MADIKDPQRQGDKESSSLTMLTGSEQKTAPCCGPRVIVPVKHPEPSKQGWADGVVETSVGPVVRVKTKLDMVDRWSSFKVRWGVNRMGYTVKPGLYAAGNPDRTSETFVSANYKLSFDRLRSNLAGIDGWILVLDTHGVNVWCAAGKGTFGTEELIRKIRQTKLEALSDNRRLIVPQLGAPGIAGFMVRKVTGFRVKFGPVRAQDIPAWLRADRVATPEMRRVRFVLKDRILLTPVEIVSALKWVGLVLLFFLLIGGFTSRGYSIEQFIRNALPSTIFISLAFLTGSFIAPILLPWLPGRSFSAKGAWIGALMATGLVAWYIAKGTLPDSVVGSIAWLFIIPTVASFMMMNFTGSSTYTSFSGVKKEMRVAVRVQFAAAVLGLGLWITGRFV